MSSTPPRSAPPEPPARSSRRQFLTRTALGVAGLAAGGGARAGGRDGGAPLAPASPPAFGTAPSTGPEVGVATFAEAEKLMQVQLTAKDRAQAASNWRQSMAALYERRTGPRRLTLGESLAPATRWDPALPGRTVGPKRNRFVRTSAPPPPLPSRDEDIAFAPLTSL